MISEPKKLGKNTEGGAVGVDMGGGAGGGLRRAQEEQEAGEGW